MSAETIEYLNQNTLIGFTEKRGTAWHYRGTNDNHFEGPVPRQRALDLLSYPLVEAGITATYLTDDGVTSIVDENRKGIVRVDTGEVMGVFSNSYQIHQPSEWCLENVDMLLDGGLQIGSVVVLKGGRVAALQAELDETRVGPEGIKHRPFLTAATSTDGSMATTYGVGTQVVVCDNTLAVALRSFDSLQKIRHTSRSLTRVGETRVRLGLIVEQAGDAFDEQVQRLLDEHVSDARWDEFVKSFTQVESAKPGRSQTMRQNKADALNDLWTNDERVAPWKNSAYGVIAAVNTAMHHVFGSDEKRVERNQERSITGKWDDIDAGTLRVLARV